MYSHDPVLKKTNALDTFYVYEGPRFGPVIRTDTHYTKEDSSSLGTTNPISLLGKIGMGGPWSLVKYEARRSFIELPVYSDWLFHLGGRFCADQNAQMGAPAAAIAAKKLSDMRALAREKGPEAVSILNPANPEVDLPVALAEVLREGVPKMVGHAFWRESSNAARAAGKEYLNAEFGWAPLVRDIKSFAKTVMDSSSIIRQYERGSGKRTRRRFDFPGSNEFLGSDTLSFSTPSPKESYIFTTGGVTTSRQYFEGSIWFEGAFRYYLAPSGIERYGQLASKLYGAKLTPETLWNLAPWSWALDWVGNVGDVLHNVSYLGMDATVMEWGFVMNEAVTSNYVSTKVPIDGYYRPLNGQEVTLTMWEDLVYKTRSVASPYSFALTPAPLSAKQQAILVALGLSHLR